jgi:hypothetical protein
MRVLPDARGLNAPDVFENTTILSISRERLLNLMAPMVTYSRGITQSGQEPTFDRNTQQATYALGALLVSLINHEYQHDCWVREMRVLLGREIPDVVWSRAVRQVDGYWVLPAAF